MHIIFVDVFVILSVNVYYLWFDCCVLILFGFIMVYPIAFSILLFIVSVLRIMYYLLYYDMFGGVYCFYGIGSG